jgi:hypothetical protein
VVPQRCLSDDLIACLIIGQVDHQYLDARSVLRYSRYDKIGEVTEAFSCYRLLAHTNESVLKIYRLSY